MVASTHKPHRSYNVDLKIIVPLSFYQTRYYNAKLNGEALWFCSTNCVMSRYDVIVHVCSALHILQRKVAFIWSGKFRYTLQTFSNTCSPMIFPEFSTAVSSGRSEEGDAFEQQQVLRKKY